MAALLRCEDGPIPPACIDLDRAIRWDDRVGSIETGKVADLLVISPPLQPAIPDVPRSPYRNLIDATEADVSLVFVGGEAVAGDVAAMQSLKPDDLEIVRSSTGCFQKAIDVTTPAVPKGTQTLAHVSSMIADGLRAMGGDRPPPGGGPSPLTNTWSYLRLNSLAGTGLTDNSSCSAFWSRRSALWTASSTSKRCRPRRC